MVVANIAKTNPMYIQSDVSFGGVVWLVGVGVVAVVGSVVGADVGVTVWGFAVVVGVGLVTDAGV